MIEFITGAAGSGKSTEMINRVKSSDCENVCIIVPEQFSYEFDKNLYKSIGAPKFNSLLSQSFTGISRHLFQIYGDGGRKGIYADEAARMILIYQAIKNVYDSPQSKRYFSRQIYRPGFAEDMLKLIEELKKSGVSPDDIMKKRVLFNDRLMDKTNDVALIYLEFEKLMDIHGFKNSFDDIRFAAETANLHKYFKGKSVYIDEFESFTGDQLDFIRVIISTADNVCISLRTDDVNAGEFTLFETVNSTYHTLVSICGSIGKEYKTIKLDGSYRFKSKDIAYLSSNILRNKSNNFSEKIDPINIKIYEAKDYYSEAEYVCASIKRLIYSDRSLHYDDIAVISNKIEEYAEILEAAFKRYEIPYFLSIEKPVIHTSLMIFISSLIDIINSRSYSSEAVFRYIKCGMTDIALTDISLLENYCYKWGIDGDSWLSEFTVPDERLNELELIRSKIIDPIEKIRDGIKKCKIASEYCSILYKHLISCGAEKNVSIIMRRLINENKDFAASEMKRLWSSLMDIFDGVSSTLGESEISFSETSRIIKSLIGRLSYSVPPQTLDSVTAASARTARLNSPKVVFVMGANDGDFPNTINMHGIFSENDKQQLSDNGIEISRRLPEIIASERLVVYKALSAASDKLFITYPLLDQSGQQKYPANIIDSIKNIFHKPNIVITEEDIKPDFYAVTLNSAFYHYIQDIYMNTPEMAAVKNVLFDDPDYKRRIMYVLDRADKKDIFHVSTEIMSKLKNFDFFTVSPSSFELFNKCKFQYFCRECLRILKREKVDLDARYSGSMIHKCFYTIISDRSKEEFLKLSYSDLEREISLSAEEFLTSEMGGEFAKNPRFELAYNKLSERLVKVFVHTQQELMASSFEPAAYEINLRDDDNKHSLKLNFGNGNTLSFGGIIDRADVCTINGDKYVRIIDYKSRRKEIDPYNLANGINMQMLLYLFTITEDKGIFHDSKPAGVLYSPVMISGIKSDETRDESENTKTVNDTLKASGLVLGDIEVLNAMEHNISNKYIPASIDKNGNISEKSSSLSANGFDELKKLTYKKLTEMAEEVLEGNADANPLVYNKQEAPCNYCDYINVCGNNPLLRYRDAYSADITEVEQILSKKREEDIEDDE